MTDSGPNGKRRDTTVAHMILLLLAWLVIPLGLDLYLPARAFREIDG